MFVGHLALALGAKRAAPAIGLGWFVAAVAALDLVWPVFVILGIEHVRVQPGATAFTPFVFESYPWSHSLVMAAVWGMALAGMARWRRVPPQVAILIGVLVVSHWVLDVISHAPDMPLWPGDSPRFGYGLWNSIPLTFVVEGAMWAGALVLYLRAVPLDSRRSAVAFWSFVAVTTLLWATGPFSPPPPTADALGWFALIGWIAVPWAVWADRRADGTGRRTGSL